MKRAISQTHGGKRPGAGRPATGKDPVRTMRLSDNFIAKVDAWATQQSDAPTRTEAIRRLVELGLAGSQLMKRRSPKATSKAIDLAGQQIDKLADPSATAEEQQQRKRRLLKGPGEFRELRADLAKKKT